MQTLCATPPTHSNTAPIARYSIVTLVGSPTNLALFYVFVAQVGWSAPMATLIAAVIVAPFTYAAYRRFVWQVESSTSTAEITKYWVMTAISVGFAMLVSQLLETIEASNFAATTGVLFAYTTIWILRFLYLDRALFPA